MCFRVFLKLTGLMWKRNYVPEIYVNPGFEGKRKWLEITEKRCLKKKQNQNCHFKLEMIYCMLRIGDAKKTKDLIWNTLISPKSVLFSVKYTRNTNLHLHWLDEFQRPFTCSLFVLPHIFMTWNELLGATLLLSINHSCFPNHLRLHLSLSYLLLSSAKRCDVPVACSGFMTWFVFLPTRVSLLNPVHYLPPAPLLCNQEKRVIHL